MSIIPFIYDEKPIRVVTDDSILGIAECGALVHLDLDGGQGRSPDDVAEQAGAWTGVLLLLIAMAAVAWGMSCL